VGFVSYMFARAKSKKEAENIRDFGLNTDPTK
jgi:hypothetical protein